MARISELKKMNQVQYLCLTISCLCRTSRKALKAETGEIVDEKEHDSAELGFMFETPDDDDEEGSDEQSDDESEQVNFFYNYNIIFGF